MTKINELTTLYVNPEHIQSVEDLEGAVLLSQAGVVFEYEYGKLVETYNLDPDKIELTNVSSAQEALALATTNSADAYWAGAQVQPKFEEAGWVPLVTVVDVGAPMYCFLVANNSYLEEHQAEVAKYLAVSEEGFEYINENLNEFAEWVEADLGLDKDLVISGWNEDTHSYGFGQDAYDDLVSVEEWCYNNGNFPTQYVFLNNTWCFHHRKIALLDYTEGFVIVALAWIVMSLFGALPFWFSRAIPHYADCFFEIVSGFTTTGASILRDIEAMEHSLLFWRSFTHWVGGMGVLVFVMAILPLSDGSGMHLMRAEVPGPTVGKLVSRMGRTAKILYAIYLGITMLEVVFLIAGGMPLFDALIHSFGTAGTGGFSCRALSVGAYDNAYFDIVIGVFMLLFGVNFNLYYFLLIRRWREVVSSEELRAYLIIVFSAVILIAVNLLRIYQSFFTSLRYSFFQVASIITTTGFSTADFHLWPTFSKVILVTLMFIGACAGSTGGGIKVARIVLLCKTSFHDMRKMLHPNAISTVHFEGKPQSEKTLRSVHLFLTVYLLVFCASVLLLSLEHSDLVTTFTAVAACLNNIGPGLEVVGPMGNYADFSVLGKLLLSLDMLLGRLEIFPILLLFFPSIWKRSRRPSLRSR